MRLLWLTTLLPLLASAAPATKSSCPAPPKPPYALGAPNTSPPIFSNAGRKNVVYFSNWAVYSANYTPSDIPVNDVTHLVYGFAEIQTDGSVAPSDPYADLQAKFTRQASRSVVRRDTNDVNGCIEEMFKLKMANRQLKTMLSVGGGKKSQADLFAAVASDDTKRQKFVDTVIAMLGDYGLDGIDLDWEYPEQSQAGDFVTLLRATREGLDKYAKDNSQDYHYLLTVAAPAGKDHYGKLDISGMDKYLDSWNIMAYDYAGGWNSHTGNQANVFADHRNPNSTPFNTDQAIRDYTGAGVAPEKLILGMPLYGRSFADTDGMGKTFKGAGPNTDDGIIPYRDLPRAGAKESVNHYLLSAYSYDTDAKLLVSYDTPDSARLKVSYVNDKKLGGVVFWEASGDKTGENSLVKTVAQTMHDLDGNQNMLSYPNSRYDNIRNSGSA